MKQTKKEKYVGAMLGAAIGDALGWPNEQNSKNINKKNGSIKTFVSWTRKGGGRYWPYEEFVDAGEYSDDTQLLIATLRSLLRGKQWSTYYRQAELPAWVNYERGGGGATKRAARKWMYNISPWDEEKNDNLEIKNYYLAGGNGVAMRIMPHTFTNEYDVEKVMKQVVLNGMYTHGHPRALIGAMLYAYSIIKILVQDTTLGYGELIDVLLNEQIAWSRLPDVNNINVWKQEAIKYAGYDYDLVWEECVYETIEYLKIAKIGLAQGILDIGNDTLEKLGCYNAKINGAGNVSAVISIYLFSKFASDPTMSLIESANLKNSDTDTIASMVGGLIGSLNGQDWIPIELRMVQDFELFDFLVNQLIDNKCDILDDSKQYKLFSNDQLLNVAIGECTEALPFGKITLKEIRNEKAKGKDMYAKTYIWKTQYGQTIFAKKIGKVDVDKNYKIQEQKEENPSVCKVNKDSILQIKAVLGKVSDANDFIEILHSIMEMQDKGGIKKEDSDLLKAKWKKYRLSKKQIDSIVKIILG